MNHEDAFSCFFFEICFIVLLAVVLLDKWLLLCDKKISNSSYMQCIQSKEKNSSTFFCVYNALQASTYLIFFAISLLFLLIVSLPTYQSYPIQAYIVFDNTDVLQHGSVIDNSDKTYYTIYLAQNILPSPLGVISLYTNQSKIQYTRISYPSVDPLYLGLIAGENQKAEYQEYTPEEEKDTTLYIVMSTEPRPPKEFIQSKLAQFAIWVQVDISGKYEPYIRWSSYSFLQGSSLQQSVASNSITTLLQQEKEGNSDYSTLFQKYYMYILRVVFSLTAFFSFIFWLERKGVPLLLLSSFSLSSLFGVFFTFSLCATSLLHCLSDTKLQKSAQVLVEQAQLYLQISCNPTLAISCIQQALESISSGIERKRTLLSLSRCYIKAKIYQKAIETLLEAYQITTEISHTEFEYTLFLLEEIIRSFEMSLDERVDLVYIGKRAIDDFTQIDSTNEITSSHLIQKMSRLVEIEKTTTTNALIQPQWLFYWIYTQCNYYSDSANKVSLQALKGTFSINNYIAMSPLFAEICRKNGLFTIEKHITECKLKFNRQEYLTKDDLYECFLLSMIASLQFAHAPKLQHMKYNQQKENEKGWSCHPSFIVLQGLLQEAMRSCCIKNIFVRSNTSYLGDISVARAHKERAKIRCILQKIVQMYEEKPSFGDKYIRRLCSFLMEGNSLDSVEKCDAAIRVLPIIADLSDLVFQQKTTKAIAAYKYDKYEDLLSYCMRLVYSSNHDTLEQKTTLNCINCLIGALLDDEEQKTPCQDTVSVQNIFISTTSFFLHQWLIVAPYHALSWLQATYDISKKNIETKDLFLLLIKKVYTRLSTTYQLPNIMPSSLNPIQDLAAVAYNYVQANIERNQQLDCSIENALLYCRSLQSLVFVQNILVSHYSTSSQPDNDATIISLLHNTDLFLKFKNVVETAWLTLDSASSRKDRGEPLLSRLQLLLQKVSSYSAKNQIPLLQEIFDILSQIEETLLIQKDILQKQNLNEYRENINQSFLQNEKKDIHELPVGVADAVQLYRILDERDKILLKTLQK